MHERAQRGSLVSLSRGRPPVTSILHRLVQSQANFDMRKGCERSIVCVRVCVCLGGRAFFQGKVEEKDGACEV